MEKKIDLTQLTRHLVQAAAFVLFPSLFLTVFNSLGDIIKAAVTGSFIAAELMPQILTIAVVLLVTVIWGRVFCGYLCAFGAVQELLARISSKLLPNKKPVPDPVDKALKYVKFAALAVIVVFVWLLQTPVSSTLNPLGVFGMLVSGNVTTMKMALPTAGLGILVAILASSFFVERSFCRYLCPLGALFTLTSGKRLFTVRRNANSCSGCGLCTGKCAMGIAVDRAETVSSGECIDCMRCIPACSLGAICANPNPAMAGTMSALLMCGAVTVGRSALYASATERQSAYEITEEMAQIAENNAPAATESGASDPAAGSEQTETQNNAGGTDTKAIMNGTYKDGVYEGTGTGFRGEIKVKVTVENSKITKIEVTSYQDDQEFFYKAESGMIQKILESQSTDVDAVTGATFSSNGILEAVANALGLDFTNNNSQAKGNHGGKHAPGTQDGSGSQDDNKAAPGTGDDSDGKGGRNGRGNLDGKDKYIDPGTGDDSQKMPGMHGKHRGRGKWNGSLPKKEDVTDGSLDGKDNGDNSDGSFDGRHKNGKDGRFNGEDGRFNGGHKDGKGGRTDKGSDKNGSTESGDNGSSSNGNGDNSIGSGSSAVKQI